jgi:hypothetical protein
MTSKKSESCLGVHQLNESAMAGVAPYNWVPKPWDKDPPTLDDTISAEVAACIDDKWVNAFRPPPPLQGHEDFPGQEQPPCIPEGKKHGFTRYVHPDSDFSHIEPAQFDAYDMLEAKAHLPRKQLDKLSKIVGRESLGMQRLACVFQWITEQSHALLTEVNEGLGLGCKQSKPDRERYNKARLAYIQFLNDLDDHEPRVRGREIIPARLGQSGYGQTIKWAYVFPAIYQGKIYGAKVIIMWNPHSSSNGIPVPHSSTPS